MAATFTTGHTFSNGETVTFTKLNNIVNLATVTGITNSEIASAAGIVASKLNLANIAQDVNLLANYDLSVASTFMANGTSNRVGLGTTSPTTAIHGKGEVLFELEDNGAAGQVTRFQQDSASPAANDAIATLKFEGRNAALSEVEYSKIVAEIISTTSSSESGAIRFEAMHSGSNLNHLEVAEGKVFVNRDSGSSATSPLNITGLPTSSAGLASGDVWANTGVLTIV